MRILLASLLLTLWLTPAWSQPSAELKTTSTPSSPAIDLPAVTHTFTDAEWEAFRDEVWAQEEMAIKDAVDAAVAPHVAYEKTLTRTATTWQLVSAGEAAGIALLALVLIFHK